MIESDGSGAIVKEDGILGWWFRRCIYKEMTWVISRVGISFSAIITQRGCTTRDIYIITIVQIEVGIVIWIRRKCIGIGEYGVSSSQRWQRTWFWRRDLRRRQVKGELGIQKMWHNGWRHHHCRRHHGQYEDSANQNSLVWSWPDPFLQSRSGQNLLRRGTRPPSGRRPCYNKKHS